MPKSSFRHNQILGYEEDNLAPAKKEGQTESYQYPPQKPKYRMDQVILPERLRHEIEEVLLVIRNKKLIYQDWGFGEIEPEPKSVISFYGPPGTGKTMAAHALAHELGQSIMALNYADIESKYVGDAPKNLVRAFNIAQSTHSILFFDEADSFLGKRIGNVTSSSDQSVNSFRSQMLIQLENFQGVVIFATNLVSNYDVAFQTRIFKHIYFELPDSGQRRHIITKMISSKLPWEESLVEKDWKLLLRASEGFSGRDLKAALLETFAQVARTRGADARFKAQDFIAGFTKRKDEKMRLDKLAKTNNGQ